LNGVLHAFRRPRLWLAIGLALVASVIIGSLLPADDLPPAPIVGFDKIEHIFGYAVLSAYAVMLFAQRRMQLLAATGLVLLGIGLEFAQEFWTVSRSADAADAVADLIGVLVGIALARTPLARMLERIDARLR
jgi:VanZ family protein